MIKTVGIVSLSSGIIGEEFIQFEVEIAAYFRPGCHTVTTAERKPPMHGGLRKMRQRRMGGNYDKFGSLSGYCHTESNSK